MSNDDVDHSMIAVLASRKSRIHMQQIITTIRMSQTLLMPLVPTGDPEIPATLAMDGLLFSWMK